jgi:pyruvate formate lyase activating enzyme
MQTEGRVFDIAPGCAHDGPGLRTVVFLKGCPLNCKWCHNIEGKSFDSEIAHDVNRCIACGACREQCSQQMPPAWRTLCRRCGNCVAGCPSRARRWVGTEYTVSALVDAVLRDFEFMCESSGGVTFSGGEPLSQSEFVFECARALRARNVHVAVETCGYWPIRLAETVAKSFDLVLFDIKHVDRQKYLNGTGRDNERVLLNYTRLLASGVALEPRITVVPGFNDTAEDAISIAQWLLKQARVLPVHLLPYHDYAASKQVLYGRAYEYQGTKSLSHQTLAEYTEAIVALGLPVAGDPTHKSAGEHATSLGNSGFFGYAPNDETVRRVS